MSRSVPPSPPTARADEVVTSSAGGYHLTGSGRATAARSQVFGEDEGSDRMGLSDLSRMSAPARDSAPEPSVPAPAPRSTALVAVRPGAIILARHGEPALSRKCLLTSDQYRDWWARYEVGGLRAGQTPPPELVATAEGAGAIYASTRQRAQETAAAVAAGKEVMSDALFIEAPLPPPHFPSWFRLPPKYWGAVARIWWHAFNHHEGQETRAQAEIRAEQAAQALIARAEAGQDVLVLAHGYFNHMVGRRLKADGWKLVHNQGYKYWSQRRYEKR